MSATIIAILIGMSVLAYVVIAIMFFDKDNPNPKCISRPLWLKVTAVVLAPLSLVIISLLSGAVLLIVAGGFVWHVCRYVFSGKACRDYKASDARAMEFFRKLTLRLEQPPTDTEKIEQELQDIIREYVERHSK